MPVTERSTKKFDWVSDILQEIQKEDYRKKYKVVNVDKVDRKSISSQIQNYLMNIDIIIICQQKRGILDFSGFSPWFWKYFMGDLWDESIHLILKEHADKFRVINTEYPYPISAIKFSDSNYLQRYQAITSLKTETMKRLKEVLVEPTRV